MKRYLAPPSAWLVLLFGLSLAAPPGARGVSCPTGGATVKVTLYNPSSTTTIPSITISGAYVYADCGGNSPLKGKYSQSVTNLLPNELRTVIVPNLISAVWNHAISVGTQNQYQKDIVLIGICASGSNAGKACQVDSDCPTSSCVDTTVNWTAFPNVITVNLAGESGTNSADCPINSVSNPPTCTLRKAILQANGVSTSNSTQTLIEFTASPGAVGGPTPPPTPQLSVTGNYITIDGTDSTGNPWIVGDANAVAAGEGGTFPTLVDLSGVSWFDIAASYLTLKGLDIQNTLPTPLPGATPTPQTKNLIFFKSGSTNGSVSAVRINGGNTLSCPSLGCGPTPISRDLINVDAGNASIKNIEGLAAIDKGVKAADGGEADVSDSWIHNNYRGGLQATFGGSSSGTMNAARNTVEKNGYRASDGVQVDPAANGIASNGASNVGTDSNVSRMNSQDGAIVAGSSSLYAYNDYLCGNRINGYDASSGGTQTALGQGISAAYNGLHGVALAGFSYADFGRGNLTSNGNNFFGQNAAAPTPCPKGGDFQNTPSANPTPNAQNNQWANGTPHVCGPVNTSSVQNGRTTPLSVNSPATVPGSSILGGQTIHVSGLGFNADDGNPAPSGGCVQGTDPTNSCCLKVSNNNTCNGTHTPVGYGNCVEYQASANANSSVTALTVTAVTPTTITAAMPGNSSSGGINCIGAQTGELVFVSKNSGSGGIKTVQGTYCTNYTY